MKYTFSIKNQTNPEAKLGLTASLYDNFTKM